MANRPAGSTSNTAGTGAGKLRQSLKAAPRNKVKKETAPYYKRTTRRRTISAEGINLPSGTEMSGIGTPAGGPPATGVQPDKMTDLATPTATATAQSAGSSGVELILARLDTMNSNQSIMNERIGGLSSSLTAMSAKVNENSAQIVDIQKELTEIKLKPTKYSEKHVEQMVSQQINAQANVLDDKVQLCLLYTSPSPRD